jgi:hypothetical protein
MIPYFLFVIFISFSFLFSYIGILPWVLEHSSEIFVFLCKENLTKLFTFFGAIGTWFANANIIPKLFSCLAQDLLEAAILAGRGRFLPFWQVPSLPYWQVRLARSFGWYTPPLGGEVGLPYQRGIILPPIGFHHSIPI